MGRRWPFVGRTAEVADALSALTDTDGVLIAGPAGIGKSRLLTEALERLTAAAGGSVHIVRVYATPATAESSFGALRRLIGPDSPVGWDPAEVMQLILHRLRELAGGGRTVLAIDDAHLLDHLSATFVYHAVLEKAVTLAATYRSGEGVPEALSRLRRGDAVTTIRLSALTVAETSAVVTEVLGGYLAPHSAARLHHLTLGNPLLLREIVDTADARTGFEQHHGLWDWSPTESVLDADPAREIESRLARLPAAVLEVADLVALSEPLELPLLLDVAGADAVERAASDRVIRTLPAGRSADVYLEHPLYGEVLRMRLGDSARTRRLYGMLADAVSEPRPGHRDDVLRRATWRLRSGTGATADLMVAAARAAYVRFDLGLAAELGQAAVAAGAGFDGIEALAAAQADGGDPLHGLRLLEDAFPKLATHDERIRCAQLIAVLGTTRFHEPCGDALYAVAQTVPPDEQQSALYLAAAQWFVCGEFERAARVLAATADDPRQSPAARLMATAMVLAYNAYRGAGDADLDRVDPPIPDSGLSWLEIPYARATVAFSRWTVMALAGAALRPAEAEAGRDSARYFPIHDGYVTMHRAMAERMAGRVTAAHRISFEAQAMYNADYIYSSACLAELAQNAALLGMTSAAVECLAASDSRHRQTMTAMYPWIGLARAQVAASCSGPRAAAEALAELLARARANGFAGVEVHTLLASARFGLSDEAEAERLADLRKRVPGRLPAAACEHAFGVSRRDPPALLRAADGYRELGLELYATEATAQALAFARAGRSPGVGGLADRTAELLAHCELVKTPALAIPVPRLSEFQLAVARGAAAGHTSPMIAERLHYTARHIDNTLHDLYRSLGAAGRADLKGLLRLAEIVESTGWL